MVMTTIDRAPMESASRQALRARCSRTDCASRPRCSSRPGSFSMRRAMRSSTDTQRSGYLPVAVSPLSITASTCSNTALATSVTSARVGIGLSIIDSSRWVATITGLPATTQRRTMSRWATGSSSNSTSTPRSPRATMTPSAASMISSRLSRPSWFSTLAMIRMGRPPPSSMTSRASRTAWALRTNDTARKSMPCSRPKRMSATSCSVIDGRLMRTPGRLMCLREPRTPPSSTRQRRSCSLVSSTSRLISPLSTVMRSPAFTWCTRSP